MLAYSAWIRACSCWRSELGCRWLLRAILVGLRGDEMSFGVERDSLGFSFCQCLVQIDQTTITTLLFSSEESATIPRARLYAFNSASDFSTRACNSGVLYGGTLRHFRLPGVKFRPSSDIGLDVRINDASGQNRVGGAKRDCDETCPWSDWILKCFRYASMTSDPTRKCLPLVFVSDGSSEKAFWAWNSISIALVSRTPRNGTFWR